MHADRRVRRWLLWAVVATAIAIIAIAALSTRKTQTSIEYQTEAVRRGDMTVSVTATGELTSLTDIRIGTEISGVIEKVTVDFNYHVTVGQVLATINTNKLDSRAAQARASL